MADPRAGRGRLGGPAVLHRAVLPLLSVSEMYPSPPLSREIESALLLRIDTMAARFSPQTPLRELLDETLDVVIVATGTRFGYVHLLNPTTGELHLMTQRGFGPELLNFFSHHPL